MGVTGTGIQDANTATRPNDLKNQELREAEGWTVITIWECDIKKRFDATMEALEMQLEKGI